MDLRQVEESEVILFDCLREDELGSYFLAIAAGDSCIQEQGRVIQNALS